MLREDFAARAPSLLPGRCGEAPDRRFRKTIEGFGLVPARSGGAGSFSTGEALMSTLGTTGSCSVGQGLARQLEHRHELVVNRHRGDRVLTQGVVISVSGRGLGGGEGGGDGCRR